MTLPMALTVWALACGPTAPDYPVIGNRWSYDRIIVEAADQALLSRSTARAVAHVETRFNHVRVSRANARGLFQILEKDQTYLVDRYKVIGFQWDRPRDSATLGCLYMADLIKRFESKKHGIMAYNAGPGRMSKALRAQKETGQLELPEETAGYWPKVLSGKW